MTIKPAILPHSLEELGEKLSRVEGFVSSVQIDLCDGVFGREKTWIPQGNEQLPADFSYEFDIMLIDWKLPTMYAIAVGAKSVVSHVDLFTDDDISSLIQLVTPRSIALGIAVSNDKSVEFHADMIRKVMAVHPSVFIQVMGIRTIGEQGQVFDEESVERVRALKQQFGTLAIQVDGGMLPETVLKVGKAGAETFVVGSYIFGSEDTGAAINRLNAISFD
jgi:ribulose-phosphate 3-epimerase